MAEVGESTVEIGALYFADVLGMRELLDETHLPKFGLQFFYGDGRNDDIAARSEFGLRDYLPCGRGGWIAVASEQLAERFVSLAASSSWLSGTRCGAVGTRTHRTVRDGRAGTP